MADSYDDKIETMLVARRRMAEQKKAERQKELQKQIAVIAGALVVLILVIVLIFKGCSADKGTSSNKKPTAETKVETTTENVQEATTAVEEATTVPETEGVDGKTMYTTDVLNFRTEASTESELIVHIPKGAKVKVVAQEGEWCNITYKKKTGYVKTEYLSETKPE